jgi:methylmalonyl-CoA mutase N-terminal domain/subunit
MERTSESGFPIDPVYDASKLTDFRPEAKLGRPGEYPFTRGVYPRMYVDRPWTMRQYAGFATASESNRRYHELIEALAPPSTKAARLALRTQQAIAYESDLTATVDPFAGSYAIEAMTDEIEAAAGALMDRIEEMGGAAAAIERGFDKAEIESAAYQVARETSFTRSATRCGPTPRSVKYATRSAMSGVSTTPVKCDLSYSHHVGADT